MVTRLKIEAVGIPKSGLAMTIGILDDARMGVIQNSRIDRAKDNRLVNRLLSNIDLDRTMQWHKNYENALMELTVDEVNEAFNRHFSLEKISIIKAGDRAKVDANKSE